eukprot:jgi/Ulvmu1/2427/UM134_0008.1
MASVSVISAAQLQSMKNMIAQPEASDKAKYLLQLHERSKHRAEAWPNTLEAQRQRKDRARRERVAASEAVRQQQDLEEAKVKEKARRATLERVNKMLFHDTDAAKSFHSAAMHCDVLAERAAQIELKQQVAALRKAQEEAFERQRREQVELAEDAALQRLVEARKRALEQKDGQMEQLEQLKASILAERAANKEAGEMLKRKAAEEAADAAEKERQARERAKKASADTARANEALLEFKKREVEREAAAEKARIAYLEEQECRNAERKRREAARAAEKEAQRKAMVDLMETKFKEFMSNENERLDRDVKAADERSAAEAAERAAVREAEWQAICASRQQQLNSRAERKRQEAMEGQAFAAAWKDRMKELVEEETAEDKAKRSHNKNISEFQKHQVALKQKKLQAAKLEKLQEAAMIEELSSDADNRFRRYAKEFIDEYKLQGKSIKPLELMLSRPARFESA